MTETTDRFSRASLDKKNSTEGAWRVNVFFFRADGSEYCRSVQTFPTRLIARQFQDDSQERLSPPSYYQGAGI